MSSGTKTKIKIISSKMLSKRFLELLIKRYEQFKCFTKIRKIANLRAIYLRKNARRIFYEKGVSAPQKLPVFFKKNRIKKQ